MAENRFDVVIVGGGVVGSAIAYFLKHDLRFTGTVAVIERDPTYATAATTLSAGSIRQQFSTPENIRMSKFGAAFLRELPQRFGPGADVAFREAGYLLLADASGAAILRANHAIQVEEGARVALGDAATLHERFPWLNVDGIAAGTLGLAGEGWFDAYALLTLLRQGAREKGVHYLTGEVTGIERQAYRIVGLRLASGERIGCGLVVNAAGPQAGDLAALAGIMLPVEPRKRCVFVVACRTPIPDMPLLVDVTGVWVRPEGRVFICGVSPPAAADRRADRDFTVDYELFEERIWPALGERIPAMQALKLERAWAGHYDYNKLDQNAVIGAHPQVWNFLFANGFSGHGLQHAPAVGRAVAELILHGRFRTLDLSAFGYGRVIEGRPMRELNVI